MLKTIEKYQPQVSEAIDKSDKAVQLAMKLGLAYVGYNVFQNPFGALFGLIALELAKAPNLPAATAGVLGLAGLGLASNPELQETLNPLSALRDAKKVMEDWFSATFGPPTESAKEPFNELDLFPSREGEWPYPIGTYEELHP